MDDYTPELQDAARVLFELSQPQSSSMLRSTMPTVSDNPPASPPTAATATLTSSASRNFKIATAPLASTSTSTLSTQTRPSVGLPDDTIDSLIRNFYGLHGRTVGLSSRLPSLRPGFRALVDKHGLNNCTLLRVCDVVVPSQPEGDAESTSEEGGCGSGSGMEDEGKGEKSEKTSQRKSTPRPKPKHQYPAGINTPEGSSFKISKLDDTSSTNNNTSKTSSSNDDNDNDELDFRTRVSDLAVKVRCQPCDYREGSLHVWQVPTQPRRYKDFPEQLRSHLSSRSHGKNVSAYLAECAQALKFSEFRETADRKRKRHSNPKSKPEAEASSDAESEPDAHNKRRLLPAPDEADSEDERDPLTMDRLGLSFHQDNIRANLDCTASDLQGELAKTLSGLAMGSGSAKWFDGSRKGICPPNLDPVKHKGEIVDIRAAQRILGVEEHGDPLRVVLPYMRSTLYASQVTAAANIWSASERYKGFFLCDEVGIGKTCSALSIFVKDIHEVKAPRETLVLCPGGIEKSTWHAEIKLRFEDLIKTTFVVHNAEDWNQVLSTRGQATYTVIQKHRKPTVPKAGVSYISVRDFEPYRVIADETQNLSNSRTHSSKEVVAVCDHAKHVIAISATPMPWHCRDLWVSLRMVLGAQTIKSYGQWVKTVPESYASQVKKLGDWLRHPWYLRRSSKDIPGMQVIESNSERIDKVHGDQMEMRIADQMQKQLRSAISLAIANLGQGSSSDLLHPSSIIFQILEGMRILTYGYDEFRQWYSRAESQIKLPQWTVNLVHEAITKNKHTAKMRQVAQCVSQELKSRVGCKILVVGRDEVFISPLIRCLGRDYADVSLSGSRPQTGTSNGRIYYSRYVSDIHDEAEKVAILRDFGAYPDRRLLIGPMQPLAEGKNLQICTHLYMLDIPRSPTALTQLEGRLLRPGQKGSVVIKRFITSNSPDELYEELVCTDKKNLGTGPHPNLAIDQLNKWLNDEM